MLNNAYIIWMAASALCAAAAQYFLSADLRKRSALTLLSLLFGAVLGAVFARLGYCLLQMDYVAGYGFTDVLLSDDLSMMSYYCGMAGVILGVILAAKCTGDPALRVLNAYAPAGALMAALARFGEYFLGTICAGNYAESGFFPLVIFNEWGEGYVAVFIIAGLLYLAIAVVSLLAFDEKRFLRTLFYLCLVQVFCESLRNQSLIWSQFIRVEQLLCMLAAETILILNGIRAKGIKNRFVPAVTGLVCAGVFVAVEFAVGGKLFIGVSPVVFYAVMALGLAVLAVLENRLMRAWIVRKNG